MTPAARIAHRAALAAARARVGALLLDAASPCWAVDADGVDVANPERCPLTLAFGDYTEGLAWLLPPTVPDWCADEWAFDHGFAPPTDAGLADGWAPDEYAAYCDALNRAWLAEVAARRVPLAAQRPAALVGVA